MQRPIANSEETLRTTQQALAQSHASMCDVANTFFRCKESICQTQERIKSSDRLISCIASVLVTSDSDSSLADILGGFDLT